jgi:glucose/mannose-6-phosphate isomerase
MASSHSGETEETLSAFETALDRGCSLLAITTGGQLANMAEQAGVAVWRYQHHGQPRAAVGFSFGMLLAALSRLGILEDPSEEFFGAIQAMQDQQASLRASVPAVKNPAKRLAGQMVGRWVTVIGSGILAPVARRWKSQINELSKTWAQFEILPEADHNTLAGVLNPEEQLGRSFVLFLRSDAEHPRNQIRNEFTRKAMMLEGLNTEFVNAQGSSPLANLWTCLHYGDYTAFYLAMAYGIDPSPVPTIEAFKRELAAEGKILKPRTQS